MKDKMLLIISIIALIGLLIFAYVNRDYNSEEPKVEDYLLEVINNERTLIDEENVELEFKDFELAFEIFEVKEYAFADLDGDKVNELIAKTTSVQDALLVLRYEQENEKVYGYAVNGEVVNDLKVDGSFRGYDGISVITIYPALTFNKHEFDYKELAVFDRINLKYEIDGKTVTREEIEAYEKAFEEKKNIEWIKIKK